MKQTIMRGTFPPAASLLGALLLCVGCNPASTERNQALFERVHAASSGIEFSNDLTSNNSFNIYTYKEFYAGGGVALGDVNNDGLLDVYLVANQKKNKLYLNRGNFRFEEITESAGVGGSKPWSTGVAMADINGDGLLDVYVTNAGAPNAEDRKNELFINNGDLTFTEQAEEFGIADRAYSIHASFFDYDNDGDLDLYVLNNFASKPIGKYDLSSVRRDVPNLEGGDRLYRNDGGAFRDVTLEAGIYSNEVSFGLGVSAGDINRDGWMDVYISNDFFERDYLYLNQGNGRFREVIEQKLSSISTTSMGGDIADLDNDGYPEIFVSDMLPGSEKRLKTVADFLEWDRYQAEVEMGYHRQFMRNTLQYNNGDGTFSEIGRYAGVEATDWSWGGLIADFNHDGLRDIFVPNGIYKDVTDKDYILNAMRSGAIRPDGQIDYQQLVEIAPGIALANYMFENEGNLRFTNRASEWGLAEPSFSTSSAYGDLDGDGDLDLVVNNVNMESFVYRNRASDLHPDRSWLQLVLEGLAPNTLGVGAQVELLAGGRRWYVEQMPQRGYQSSMDPVLHIGLGVGISTIDSLKVRWPDGRATSHSNVNTRRRVTVRQADALDQGEPVFRNTSWTGAMMAGPLLADVTGDAGIDWRHVESTYDDFARSPLLFHMSSTNGPALCSGDFNADGLDDLYVGGARDQAGALFVQNKDGRFKLNRQSALIADRGAEDTDCQFFDADGDGIPELYVASGSSEFPAGSEALADRLYRVSGDGVLVRSDDALPRQESLPTGVVRAADLDGDGDLDLFVGTRMGSSYGVPVGGYLLENDGTGKFADATDRLAPQLRPQALGAAGITDAAWGDLNSDGTPDLLIAGEWMQLTVFFNRGGKLERADSKSLGLDGTHGLWQRLAVADLNGDGALDIVGGNIGLNSRFRASPDRPLQMWAGDFSRSGRVDQIFASYTADGGPYPLALRHNLLQQFPHLSYRFPTFADYAGKTVEEVFSREDLDRGEKYRVELLASVVGWNNGDGSFKIDSLPFRAQLAPIYGILVEDLDKDGIPEILLGGNLDAVRPQEGPYDAGYGMLLKKDASGMYRDVPRKQSGFFSPGEIRAIRSLRRGGQTVIVVARNNDHPQVFRISAQVQ